MSDYFSGPVGIEPFTVAKAQDVKANFTAVAESFAKLPAAADLQSLVSGAGSAASAAVSAALAALSALAATATVVVVKRADVPLGLPDDTIIFVAVDETQSGQQSVYKVIGGGIVYQGQVSAVSAAVLTAGMGTTVTAAQGGGAIKGATEYRYAPNSFYSPITRLGPGVFSLSQTLEPNAVFTLTGHSTGYTNGGALGVAATQIIAPVNTTAMRIKVGSFGDTVAAGNTNAGGSIIENVAISQVAVGSNRDAHGIHSRGTIFIRDSTIRDVSGDGINITAAFDGGPATYGNANNWYLNSVQIVAEGYGLCVGKYKGLGGGADTNAGLAIGLNVHRAGKAGIYDQSYYANTYIAPQLNQTGNNGVHYSGATWQLIVETSLGSQPGSNGDWYKLRFQASPDVNFPTWDSATRYYATGPILAFNPAVVITPYQENGRTLGHVPGGLVIGGNMGVTQTTPRIAGLFNVGLVCNQGVGHYRTPSGDPAHPAFPFIGDEELTVIGAPSDNGPDLHKRARILKHRVGGSEWLIGYEGVVGGVERDILSRYQSMVQWSISGKGTARTYGRIAPVEGVYSLHDHALIDATDGGNARIRGMRALNSATTGTEAAGEWYENPNLTLGGPMGYGFAATGGPKVFSGIFGGVQIAAIADLAADATLPQVVAKINEMLAKARTARQLAA